MGNASTDSEDAPRRRRRIRGAALDALASGASAILRKQEEWATDEDPDAPPQTWEPRREALLPPVPSVERGRVDLDDYEVPEWLAVLAGRTWPAAPEVIAVPEPPRRVEDHVEPEPWQVVESVEVVEVVVEPEAEVVPEAAAYDEPEHAAPVVPPLPAVLAALVAGGPTRVNEELPAPDEPPLSRRERRQAAKEAREAPLEPLVPPVPAALLPARVVLPDVVAVEEPVEVSAAETSHEVAAEPVEEAAAEPVDPKRKRRTKRAPVVEVADGLETGVERPPQPTDAPQPADVGAPGVEVADGFETGVERPPQPTEAVATPVDEETPASVVEEGRPGLSRDRRSQRIAALPRPVRIGAIAAAVVLFAALPWIVPAVGGLFSGSEEDTTSASATVPGAPDDKTLAGPVGVQRANPLAGVRLASAGQPVRIRVPRFSTNAEVVPVRMRAGRVAPPVSADVVGWWRDGKDAGAASGSVVLSGHLGRSGGGALDDLVRLRRGDTVRVLTKAGTIIYRVTSRAPYSGVDLRRSSDEILRLGGDGRLVLVLGDRWNGSVYRYNTVIIASPIADQRAGTNAAGGPVPTS